MTSQSCRTTHRSAGPKGLFITKRNVENLTCITVITIEMESNKSSI